MSLLVFDVLCTCVESGPTRLAKREPMSNIGNTTLIAPGTALRAKIPELAHFPLELVATSCLGSGAHPHA